MGFESSLSELSPATPVPTETQVIPTSGLKLAAQQEVLEKLSHTPGVLDVRESPAQTGLTVTFVPSLTSPQQLNEMVDSMMLPQSDAPRNPNPNLSPSHSTRGGVSLLKLCIEGMTCHSCVTTIEGKIGKLNGVEKIKGDVLEHFTYLQSCINLVREWESYSCTTDVTQLLQIWKKFVMS